MFINGPLWVARGCHLAAALLPWTTCPVSTVRKKAKSGNPTARMRAQFALNARKWRKGRKMGS
jgi:hypothetical protein